MRVCDVAQASRPVMIFAGASTYPKGNTGKHACATLLSLSKLDLHALPHWQNHTRGRRLEMDNSGADIFDR